ncbi:hypothetical protein COLO4_26536 [Corchorus olitorius]|uniref:Uncharacterized protein n=1 Tax=Corchorus olitorius TaxID=93759 RepID=A0A1R3HWH4_9ROSI|nr:hypothetical protein COLO4_26536 [Corchorus olitorius]
MFSNMAWPSFRGRHPYPLAEGSAPLEKGSLSCTLNFSRQVDVSLRDWLVALGIPVRRDRRAPHTAMPTAAFFLKRAKLFLP